MTVHDEGMVSLRDTQALPAWLGRGLEFGDWNIAVAADLVNVEIICSVEHWTLWPKPWSYPDILTQTLRKAS